MGNRVPRSQARRRDRRPRHLQRTHRRNRHPVLPARHQQDQHDSVPQGRLTGCDAVGMRSDGRVLPDLTQTLVLPRLGLIRSDELPDLAARWLAAGMTDTESTRMLAGHPRHDPWGLDQLLSAAADETGTTTPADAAAIEDIALTWVASRWLDDHDTRAAVRTLARLGETNL